MWDKVPVIFDEGGAPATAGARWRAMLDEYITEVLLEDPTLLEDDGPIVLNDEAQRTCPWCGKICESVKVLAVHEEECE